ncbi:outer membrane beta-barrel protein [Microbulbifer pacificus]|uniref:Outer membrane beta-barrel protein n=1 Tax=Microbulbifer pacificus TaxID=407164 RepID=A0AAU0N2M3_9GAMM|nr:outer membrane beta-barrel protein [Microbulbifer pacificus]WOX06723.1 outer membrane beta-barrel protein [Microbulbifer pacificus]
MLKKPFSTAAKLSCVAFSALWLPAVAEPIKLGSGFLLSPAISMDTRYDDNITNAPEDGIDSFLLLTNPRIGLEYDRGTILYSLQYSLSYGDYLDSERDSFTDHSVTASADWEISNRHSLSAGAAYLNINQEFNDQVTEDLDSLIFERDRYHQSDLFITYGYGAEGARGHLELTLGATDRNYVDEIVARDRRTPYGSALLSLNLGGKTALLTRLEGRNIRYEDNLLTIPDRDNDEATLMLGIERNTEQLTALLMGGMVRKQFLNDGTPDYQRPRWIASFAWSPLETSRLTLTAERRPIDSAAGIANFVDATSGLVEWQHSWSEKISSNAFFRYTDAEYAGAELTENIRRWGMTLRYQFRPWLDFRTGVSALAKNASDEILSYERNQVFLGFDASY